MLSFKPPKLVRNIIVSAQSAKVPYSNLGFDDLVLSWQAREFARELQSSTVVKQTITASLDRLDSSGRNQQQSPKESAGPSSSSACVVSDAYAKLLQTFIPYLVDEVLVHSLFFSDLYHIALFSALV